MGSRAERAARMSHARGIMHMGYLNRRAKNQQQGTAKSKRSFPPVPHGTFAWLFVHHFHYNVTAAPAR